MSNYNADWIEDRVLRSMPFARLGANVKIHPTVVLVGIENICIGNNTRLDPFMVVTAAARVVVGSYVHIGSHCYLAGGAGITIEDFANFSQGCRLYSTSDDYSGAFLTNPTVPKAYTGRIEGPIRVGRHVIMGSGSVVLPNVAISEGCAVGALSLVRSSTDAWGVYAGVPARRIRDRSQNLLAHERAFRLSVPNPTARSEAPE
jgi:acetyltransferase-like isoleucine patch superfamily enzyme